ncbi:vitellogenin 3, phosvitinless [Colossoma macropomum]|uniref:vitellogenin 3, phosvitinless n=1 Tax=Colossoma macropomum TaxID=42526 RepID=UPI0018646EE3|nr:vitellogenin 3, phosvitinless [Colossoma macropomum]
MHRLLFCLSAALAASESINYEPTLNPKKTYEYKYEGVVRIGRDMADLAESGVKMQCTFKITGVSVQTFLLQIYNMVFEEFNGIPGQSLFKVSPNLTKRLAAELNRPFTFEYSKGQIGDIKTAGEVSNTIVNIVRGIVGFLHVTVKTTQRVYELNELGIHGVCHSAYAIEENAASKELYVTQIVDINDCHQKAAVYRGMALAEENKNTQQRGDNAVATVKYAYTVKSVEGGGLITKASAQERHHFTPFNVKGGNCKLQAARNIVLLKEMDTVGKPVTGQVKNRGNLMYKMEKGVAPIPVVMINLNDPVPKIANLIKRLAQGNIYQLNSTMSSDVLALIQLLRASTHDDLELLWKQLSGNNEHRRWFLDTVVEVTDERVLKFLKIRFKAGDITASEAGQAVLVAFNHLSAEPELVESAKEFLTIPFSKSHSLLWNTVVLSYGSLVYRACAHETPCPVNTVQPLLDMANNGLTKKDDKDMVLALKALGNAGHPLSIKTIMKFLPGFSVKADSLSTRVQSLAVQSLRHLASRDPHTVQDIALTIFAERTLPAEIRMLASMILLETKPPVALISAVAELLLQETDLQVASFTYSQLRAISRSRTPDNQHLSTACNIAVKVLARKFGRLSYRYSKALHLDWFRDELLTGTSSEFYLLRNGTSTMPTEIISKGKLYFIGRILQLTELGVRAEGLKELFTDRPEITKDFAATDFAAIMKILSDWQSVPKNNPLLSVHARVFGQEVSFLDLNQDVVQQILKSVSLTASKENKIWNIIQHLQKGISWHWTKPYLILETQFIQPTCLGLPVEISKYLSALTAITVNVKAVINPPPKEHLRELLNADVSLQTDGFFGVAKDFFVFHGINTELFQCGAQLNSKMVVALPWKTDLKKNAKEKNYELNLTPCKKATELLSVNSDVYAVSRNIEDPLSAKMTPMMSDVGDFEQSFAANRKETDKIRDYQDEGSEIYHPKLKYCAQASTYGTAFCTQAEAKRVYYLKEYPLYYFLGYTHFSCQLEPVRSVKPVEKIKIQISVGPQKHKPEVSQMMFTQKLFKGTDAAPETVISVRVLAVSPNVKALGYEAAAYYTSAEQRDDIELIVSEVAEEVNWKICADLSVQKIQAGAKAHFKWGAECQSYEVALKVSTAGITGPKPFLNAEINWGDVPSFMQALGQRVQEYLPGVSYLMGFYQKHEKNTEHEVSAMLVASTQEGFDVKVKIPELTVYRQEIPSPFEIVGVESDNSNISHI